MGSVLFCFFFSYCFLSLRERGIGIAFQREGRDLWSKLHHRRLCSRQPQFHEQTVKLVIICIFHIRCVTQMSGHSALLPFIQFTAGVRSICISQISVSLEVPLVRCPAEGYPSTEVLC